MPNEKPLDFLEYTPSENGVRRENLLRAFAWLPGMIWLVSAGAAVVINLRGLMQIPESLVETLYVVGIVIGFSIVPIALRRKSIAVPERLLVILFAAFILVASQLFPILFMGG